MKMVITFILFIALSLLFVSLILLIFVFNWEWGMAEIINYNQTSLTMSAGTGVQMPDIKQ